MNDVDTYRRSEAEARQEMQKRTCADCGEVVDDCDAFQCPECHLYYCQDCMTGIPGHRLCGECMEKEEAFNEVEEIDIGHPLYVDDPLGTIARSKKYDKRIEDKRHMAMLRWEEEHGK